MTRSSLTYRDAGVNIDAGERLVDRIKPLAASTRTAESLGSLGGFAALCKLPTGMREPILVSGTDGVGTKLKIAFEAEQHGTVGIDLVAMCANDVVTVGARPLFFLDYYATATLEVDTAASVIEGIAEGCKQAGCALLGGETAELPGMYKPKEYDLAGFVVGVVERDQILDGSAVRSGDVVLGLASNGLHSNGYSLARAALFDRGGLRLDSQVEELGGVLAHELLKPTRIYCRASLEAIATGGIHALCHVTGGGLVDNLPRVLPAGCEAVVDEASWPTPAIFELCQRLGAVAESEMRRSFNMGVGMVAVVDPASVDAVTSALTKEGERVFRIGEVSQLEDTQAAPRVRYL